MKSPFVPYAVFWLCLGAAAYAALRFWLPPFPEVWRILAALNVGTFALYGIDKAIAGSGAPRVPERLLQASALLGSPVGALAAMQVFRHKTRKLSFQLVLALILLFQAVVAYLAFLRK